MKEDRLKILLTGCTGFIGSDLLNKLNAAGHEVWCISRSEKSCHKKHITADISKEMDILRLPQGLDCIIHLASIMDGATSNMDMFMANVGGTLNLLEYGKRCGIKHFIYASSGAVYGYADRRAREDDNPNPIGFYGLSKYQAELLVEYYKNDFSTTILRLFFPYGPGQINGIVARLTQNIKQRQPIMIYGSDKPKINPLYITDLTDAILRSLSLAGSHTINLSGTEVLTIKELALIIGASLEIEPIFIKGMDDHMSDLIGDNEQMISLLGVQPKVLLETGIAQYLNDKR